MRRWATATPCWIRRSKPSEQVKGQRGVVNCRKTKAAVLFLMFCVGCWSFENAKRQETRDWGRARQS